MKTGDGPMLQQMPVLLWYPAPGPSSPGRQKNIPMMLFFPFSPHRLKILHLFKHVSHFFSHDPFPMIHFQSFFSHFGWWLCIKKGTPSSQDNQMCKCPGIKAISYFGLPSCIMSRPCGLQIPTLSVSLRFRTLQLSCLKALALGQLLLPTLNHLQHINISFYPQLQKMV